MARRALMVVAKQPAPGQTKTRLSPPLRGQDAAALYECFLRDTLDTIRRARESLEFQPIIAYLPPGAEGYFRELAPDFERLLQQGENLSERLHNATAHCLLNGFDQAIIMDSDSPTLPAANLCQAFRVLDDGADVSLGPCDDGGYYLIGLKQPAPDLFLNVTMSTRVGMLPICYDIDYVADLRRLVSELDFLPHEIARHSRQFLASRLSIVGE